ncbi:hypothetical protein [Bacillus suaedaesalsae]|uniref:Lipoprotein n=1 Tax=Bacillus suaedaesalsae TaxID=2810349 RepID=A0ABS2DH93_9BACI|nr:hypothetical protein [Bacillus suaedaesalsae]MBM6617856.1 hypothetical protein [Bacillus suaedaesalsae]
MGKSVSYILICMIWLLAGCSSEGTVKNDMNSKVLITYTTVPDTTTGTTKEKYTVENLENLEDFLLEKTEKLEVRHDSQHGAIINNVSLTRVDDGTYEVTFDGFKNLPDGTHTCEEVDVYAFGLMINKCMFNGESVYETNVVPLSVNDIIKYGRLLKLNEQ